jgi:hypothetical protein
LRVLIGAKVSTKPGRCPLLHGRADPGQSSSESTVGRASEFLMHRTGIRDRFGWLAHALSPRRNPLRRRLDRLTAAIILLFAVLGLMAIPVSAEYGNIVHQQQSQLAAQERVERYQVAATLTAPPQTHTSGGSENFVTDAPVKWTDRTGRDHAAVARVPDGSLTDSTTAVWIDQSDRLVSPPRSEGAITMSAVSAALWVLLSAEVCCFVLATTAQYLAGVYARRAWAREWKVVARRWTGPRQ